MLVLGHDPALERPAARPSRGRGSPGRFAALSRPSLLSPGGRRWPRANSEPEPFRCPNPNPPPACPISAALGAARSSARRHSGARGQPASRRRLRHAAHRAGIHFAVPGHRPAGLRSYRDRFHAGPMARRIEIAEALSRQFPQSRRLSRRLHGADRQGSGRAAEAALAAHRRLLVSARRHSDRRLLADRRTCPKAPGRPTRASRPIADADRRASSADDGSPPKRRLRRRTQGAQRPPPREARGLSERGRRPASA